MKRIYLFFLFLLSTVFICSGTYAQQSTLIPKGKHEYYIYLEGIHGKSDVRLIENKIRSVGPLIKYFGSVRYPVSYFLLVSDETITPKQFLVYFNDQNSYRLIFYEEGNEAKEKVINLSKRLNKQ